MNFYEHTLVAKQNLSQKDVDTIEKKYEEIINKNSGKVLKIEKWGLLNFKRKIKNYTKGYFLHLAHRIQLLLFYLDLYQHHITLIYQH